MHGLVMNKDGIEITLENNELTIVGHRDRKITAADLRGKGTSPIFRRVSNSIRRSISGKISPRLAQAVLT